MRACNGCPAPATRYIMGPYPGDWADYYCDQHPTKIDPGSSVEPFTQEATDGTE